MTDLLNLNKHLLGWDVPWSEAEESHMVARPFFGYMRKQIRTSRPDRNFLELVHRLNKEQRRPLRPMVDGCVAFISHYIPLGATNHHKNADVDFFVV